MARAIGMLVPALAVLAMAAGRDAAAQIDPNAYSVQNLLIGATPALQMSANNGAGVSFGVIDTGVAAGWAGFVGRINTNASACMLAACTTALAVTDDEGHGTFVASEIVATAPGSGYLGVAPAAVAISVKVLNAQGVGTTNGVANSIVYAVDRGAQVLNLSLSFEPTRAVLNAINYAASKNAVIVFAGGNERQFFQGGTRVGGLTDAAIARLFFMGATDANKRLAWFSNVPGSGGFVSTSGAFYPFATRWLVADGVNVWGASTQPTAVGGPAYLTQDSGTSMATPQGAGAAGLLAARWPFLLKSGAVAQILLQSAQPLGSNGVNQLYGEGFLRVDQAFNPMGQLVVFAGGALQNPMTAQIVASGPLGTMSQLARQLKDVVLLDAFGRDFKGDLSGNVAARKSTPIAAMQSLASTTTTKTARLGEGNTLTGTVTSSEDPAARTAFAEASGNPLGKHVEAWSFVLSSSQGAFAGGGYGGGAASAFADGLLGSSTGLTRTSLFSSAGSAVSGSLLGLADMASYGVGAIPVGPGRLAFAVSNASTDGTFVTGGGSASANAAALGYSVELTEAWRMGVTLGTLAEQGELLGSSFSGPLALGRDSRSTSIGLIGSVSLDDVLPRHGLKLTLDAVYATTDPGRAQNSLVESAGTLKSAGFGLALSMDGLLGESDTLAVGIATPLRVFAGSANLLVPVALDADGNVVTERRKASLVSSGYEKDIDFVYSRPLFTRDMIGSVGLQYRNDADQVGGRHAVRGVVSAKYRF